MKKTISQLNSKMWYRSIKVAYIILILSIFTLGILLAYDGSIHYPMNYDKTRITCKSKDFFSDKSFEITKGDYGISGKTMTKEQQVTIGNEYCPESGKFLEFFNELPTDEDYLAKNPSFTASHGVSEKRIKLDQFIGSVLGFTLLLIVISEILRRVFYYIILGTLIPKK